MRFTVDLRNCQNHGQCTIAAPETFSLDDDSELTFRHEADDVYRSGVVAQDQEAAVLSASAVCPMQAISVSD